MTKEGSWENIGTKTETYELGYGEQYRESKRYTRYETVDVTTIDGKLTSLTIYVKDECGNGTKTVILAAQLARLFKLYEKLGREGKIPVKEENSEGITE